MKDEDKLKNIKDLEYNHLLNNQNVFLIVLATAIISIILSDKFPETLTKGGLITASVLATILVLLYYRKKLSDKIDDIKGLKELNKKNN